MSEPDPAPAPPRQAPIVAALGFTQILAFGTTIYLPTVLAKPMAADTGWPLTWVVGGLSIGMLAAGVVSPWVGRRIQQHGGRLVMAASSLLLAAGLALLAAAPSLAVYYAGWLLIGLGMGSGLYDAAFAALGRLYGQAARGAITTLTLYGGFASTICWPFSAYMAESFGWRAACLVYAGLHLLVAFPLHLLMLPPDVAAASPTAAAREGGTAGKTLSPSQRRSFLILLVITTAGSLAAGVVSVHVITLLEAREVAFATAVALAALIGPSQVGARFVEMAFGRHYHPIITLIAATGLVAAGLGLVLIGAPLLALGLILYGGGNGIWSIARGTVPLALFGPSRYGVVIGRLALPALLAQAAAAPLSTILIARLGAEATIAALAGLALLNVGLAVILWLRGYHRGTPDGA